VEVNTDNWGEDWLVANLEKMPTVQTACQMVANAIPVETGRLVFGAVSDIEALDEAASRQPDDRPRSAVGEEMLGGRPRVPLVHLNR
jgi:hypothetical protein